MPGLRQQQRALIEFTRALCFPCPEGFNPKGCCFNWSSNTINSLRSPLLGLQLRWYVNLTVVIPPFVTKSYCRITFDLHMTIAEVAGLLNAVPTER